MDAFDFGLRIRELRESRNMSQETLGKKMDEASLLLAAMKTISKLRRLMFL